MEENTTAEVVTTAKGFLGKRGLLIAGLVVAGATAVALVVAAKKRKDAEEADAEEAVKEIVGAVETAARKVRRSGDNGTAQ